MSTPDVTWKELQSGAIDAVKSTFPIEGRTRTLVLNNVTVDDSSAATGDLRSQERAKETSRTWGANVVADISLVDKATKTVIDRSKTKIFTLPKPTDRYSYIVDGSEWQVDNLWRLKPGVYSQIKANGDLETEFALAGASFAKESRLKIPFSPENKKFKFRWGTTNINLYPILKTLGVQDEDMKKAWGPDIYKANSTTKIEQDIQKLYKGISKRGVKAENSSYDAIAAAVFKEFHNAELAPDTTKHTLGKSISHVTGEALLLASKRILDVAQGVTPPDDRNSLIFKKLTGVDDFLRERLSKSSTQRVIKLKVGNNIDRADKVRDILSSELFSKPIKQIFTSSSLSKNPEQTNPLEMLSNYRSTTILGGDEGGIKSDRTLNKQMKLINPTHMGFLDPIHTPESVRTGISLTLPMGVMKDGNEARAIVYDLKEHKLLEGKNGLTPAELHSEFVLLPDQVKTKDGKPVPTSSLVKMKDPQSGEIVLRPMKDARYMFVSPHQLFDEATNLIPFLPSNQGNRTMTASRQASQAVGLRDREIPLVQVKGGNTTWEHLVGIPFSHTAPVDGKIVAIKTDQSDNRFPDSIILQDHKGTKHEVQLYNHFPLNDTKTFMHSIPRVSVGQDVKVGDLIADTNYTKDGTLALGTNLRVSYMPYKGYNFEDGIVISDSAAKKLTSEHVHRKSIEIDPSKDSMNKKKFQAFSSVTAKKYGKTQLDRLDDDGVIRVGEKVNTGDLLIAAIGKKENLGMVSRLASRLDKSLFDRTDRSISWDGAGQGEVVKVQKLPNGKGAVVHVRTDEPAEVGDKIVGRHGNKCFDSETEVLTDQGWKRFAFLDRSEKIATLDPVSFKISYQSPSAYVAESYRGKMYRFQGRRLDLLVTPNHSHFVRGRSDRSKEEGQWRLESAEDCFGKQRVHLRTGEWSPGDEIREITIPGRPHESHQHYKFSEPTTYEADDFLEFFGYWITEGCTNDGKILVAQRKEVNPETYELIRLCITRLGYEPWCYPDTLGFSDPRLAHWLEQFEKSRDKYIPRSFLTANQRQLRILADACFAGDGGVYYREKDNHTRYELFTSSKKLADDYQELAFKLGMSANIKEADDGRKVVRFSLNPEVWTTKDIRYGDKESWVDYDGMIYCVEVPHHIIYVRRNGIPVWSGNSIVTQIIPDHEMPRIGAADGQHVEVLMNPSGVPSRINLGQMLETASSKIAKKTGKSYIVNNFDIDVDDYTEKVKQDLKDHGLKDTEEIYDPVTRKKLGDVLTGDQYIMKLKHQVDKKLAVRSTANYTIDRSPKGTGAENPGQGIGQLEFYALLAHGARKNLKEMATYKADQQVDERLNPQAHIDFWHRVQMGQPLPAPRPTFAYRKFESYLTGLGIDVRKEGHEMQLVPLTDKGVLALSNGEIEDPGRVLRGKDAKELDNGLFDPKITGGLPDSNEPGKGLHWAHITLARPVPSPVFVGTAQKPGPAVILTGLKFTEFEDIVKGKKNINGKTGGEAIKSILDGINVKKELNKVMGELSSLHGSALNHANRKAKYLRALDNLDMKPSEAYIMNHVPVIPPVFRPIVDMPDGSLRFDDINHLYKDLGIVNNKLKEGVKDLPEVEQPMREELYDLLKSTMGVGGIPQYDSSRKLKGILDTIAGTSPKYGYFQKKIMKRRQEMSMRSTIIPEPGMHLDYVGIPRSAAMELYKPFVLRELKKVGRSPLEARKDLKEETPAAWKALEKALDSRPVLLKRDPALHKFSIMAFKPKLVDGKAIRIHPLVTSGFNADFDGDTMSAFLPLTDDAVRESHKMFPSNNLFSPTNGGIMYAPSQESLLGLHLLSKWGEDTGKNFPTFDHLKKEYDRGAVKMNDVVSVNGKKTTHGRRVLASQLPKEFQTDQLLYSPGAVITKKGGGERISILDLLADIGKKDPKKFAVTVDRLKDVGNQHAYDAGFSLSLSDLKVYKDIRDPILAKADEEVDKVRKSSASAQDKEDKIVALYDAAGNAIDRATRPHIEKSNNNIFTMVDSGARGNWSQFRQMNQAPMIMQDATGRKLPTPVKRSYSEGLDVGDYWTALHGARMGTLQRAEGTSEPGMLTKDIINFVMPEMIVSKECGTKEGISMDITDDDVHDRLLAKPINVGGQKFERNTIITPALTSLLKKNHIDQIVVRSPLKCQHGTGICSKCFGLSENGQEHEIGTNIGVIAGHSLGEPAMQLAMDCNAAGNLITVNLDGRRHILTFEQLWNRISSTVDVAGDIETKIPENLEVWDHNKMVPVHSIQRHKPHGDMFFARTESGHCFISQDSHPNWVREDIVRCPKCGDEEPVKFVSHHKSGDKTTVRCTKCETSHTVSRRTYTGQQEIIVRTDHLEGTYMGVCSERPVEETGLDMPLPSYLLGIFLAEGNVRRERVSSSIEEGTKQRQEVGSGLLWKVLSAEITQDPGLIQDKIKEHLLRFNIEFTTPGISHIRINDVVLARKLWAQCGIHSNNKQLPPGWLTQSNQWKLEFLAGLLDGDGTLVSNHTAALDTTSWSLVSQVQQLIRSLGGWSTVYLCTVKDLTRHQGFRVTIDLGHKLPSIKNFPLVEVNTEPRRNYYSKVVQVKKVEFYTDWTYDLSTSTRGFSSNYLKTHNSFHTGGVSGSRGAGATTRIGRLKELLKLPAKLPDSATLARASGKVEKIEKDPTGWNVYINGQSHFAPATRKLLYDNKPLEIGMVVKKGSPITEGPINPRELLPLTDVPTVQNHLVSELYDGIYKDERVRRRNIETVVRSLTNLTQIRDPGDSSGFMTGDVVSRSLVEEHNRNLEAGHRPIEHRPVLKGMEQGVLDTQEDWLARLNFRRLKETIMEGAAKGWKTNLHGTHPVPAYAVGATFGEGTAREPWKYG